MNSKTKTYLYILIITVVAAIGTAVLLRQIQDLGDEEAVGYLTDKPYQLSLGANFYYPGSKLHYKDDDGISFEIYDGLYKVEELLLYGY